MARIVSPGHYLRYTCPDNQPFFDALTRSTAHKTEAFRYQDALRRFTRALASLSAMEQELYYLWCYQELPVRQLADRYGLSPTAVNGRLRRIQTKLEQACQCQLPA